MTPYELSKIIHQELSPVAPRLSAALNRALVDIGEGSILVGLGPCNPENDPISFQEVEVINTEGSDAAAVLLKISEALTALENHSSWKVIIDKKPGSSAQQMELLYTIFRPKKTL